MNSQQRIKTAIGFAEGLADIVSSQTKNADASLKATLENIKKASSACHQVWRQLKPKQYKVVEKYIIALSNHLKGELELPILTGFSIILLSDCISEMQVAKAKPYRIGLILALLNSVEDLQRLFDNNFERQDLYKKSMLLFSAWDKIIGKK